MDPKYVWNKAHYEFISYKGRSRIIFQSKQLICNA